MGGKQESMDFARGSKERLLGLIKTLQQTDTAQAKHIGPFSPPLKRFRLGGIND